MEKGNEIKIEKFKCLKNKPDIEILNIQGKSATPKAINWLKQNAYHWLTLPELTKFLGYSGLTDIFGEVKNYEKREWGAPTKDITFLLNSFFISNLKKSLLEINKMSSEEFYKNDWFDAYVSHNPKFEEGKIKKYNDLFLEITNKDKLNLVNLNGSFKFSGDGYHGISWLEKDISKMDDVTLNKIFGENYISLKENFKNIRYGIFYGDSPKEVCIASPIYLFIEHDFSFSTLPYFNNSRESQGNPKINLFPIIKN